jgi:hypothetical protein
LTVVVVVVGDDDRRATGGAVDVALRLLAPRPEPFDRAELTASPA